MSRALLGASLPCTRYVRRANRLLDGGNMDEEKRPTPHSMRVIMTAINDRSSRHLAALSNGGQTVHT
jgi:hypothetical protein